MSAILVIARLTIMEALRRRVVIAAALIGFVVAAIGFIPFPPPAPSFFAPDAASAMLLRSQSLGWMGCGMIKFFSSVLAVTLAAGAISSEVERGVLSTIAPKPLPRLAIYLGKWLGLIALLACFLAVWGGLLAWDVWHQTRQLHPRLFLGLLATGLFPLLFATLTLFFSTIAGFALSAGLALIAAGCSLAEDIIHFFGVLFDVHALDVLSKAVGYVVPISRMNHWITRGLGNAGHDWSAFNQPGTETLGMSAVQTSVGDLVYIVVYILAFLAAGAVLFQRRDL